MRQETIQKKKNGAKKNTSKSYNKFKQFEGKKYTGMKVGRTHKWYYDNGEWKEKKITPDKWEFTYSVKKTRAWQAPEGSGVPVGTEYHWYILADQNVRTQRVARKYVVVVRRVFECETTRDRIG